jgi:hypothetical protein
MRNLPQLISSTLVIKKESDTSWVHFEFLRDYVEKFESVDTGDTNVSANSEWAQWDTQGHREIDS